MALPKVKNAIAARQKATKRERKNLIRVISQYIKEIRSEFRKVMWPDRPEITSATTVVFVTLIFFVIIIGIIDLIFAGIINRLLPLIGG